MRKLILFLAIWFCSGNSYSQSLEVSAYPVYFLHNSYDLTKEAKEALSYIKTLKLAEDAKTIIIHGHTDRSGSNTYNLKLSKRRAKNVAAEMIKNGYIGRKMKIEWTGENNPPFKTRDGFRQPLNRCVVLKFLE